MFADDKGRVKETLNLNKADEAALKSSQPPKMYDNLKYSNIHFVHDEMGPVTVLNHERSGNRNFGIKKNSVSIPKAVGHNTTS